MPKINQENKIKQCTKIFMYRDLNKLVSSQIKRGKCKKILAYLLFCS